MKSKSKRAIKNREQKPGPLLPELGSIVSISHGDVTVNFTLEKINDDGSFHLVKYPAKRPV